VKRGFHTRRQDPPRSQKRPLPTLRAGPAGLDPWSSNRYARPPHPETVCAQTNGRDGAVRAPRVPSRRDGQGALLRSFRCTASRLDACSWRGSRGMQGGRAGRSPIGPLARGWAGSPPFPRPAPSAPLPRAWAAQAHRFPKAPGRSPTNPLAAGVGCASPPFPRSARGAAPQVLAAGVSHPAGAQRTSNNAPRPMQG
jgi:hypothetical protein